MKIPRCAEARFRMREVRCRSCSSALLARAGGSWLEFAFLAGERLAFVMSMCAAQEWNSIEDVLLEPFEPEINHWRNKQRDQLRKNQAANNHQSERAARGRILTKTKGERHRAH